MKGPMAIEIKARPVTKEEAKILKKIDKKKGEVDSLARKLAKKKPGK